MSVLFALSLVALCVSVFYSIVYYWNRKKLYEIAAKYNGPVALPVVGNALLFAGYRQDELLARIVQVLRNYKSPVRFWLGPKLIICLYEPDQLEVILTNPKCANKGSLYRFMEPILGRGLVSGSGPMWKAHRKIITPTLNSRILEKFIPVFNEQAQILLECIAPEANTGKVFNALEHIENCTIDILCETIMNTKLDAQTSEKGQTIFGYLRSAYVSVYTRMVKVWLHPDSLFQMTTLYRNQTKAGRSIRGFILQSMERIKKELSEEIMEDKKMLTTIQKLIEYQNEDERNITTEEIIDEILTMFVAGQDTTALITGFILLMLGMHPEIQRKVHDESKNVFGGSTGPLELADYQRLEYLDMVIKEAVRLFPIAPIMLRTPEEDVQIGKNVIPAGSDILLAAYIAHRHPDHWKDPESFVPERFLPEESVNRHPFAYVPFSHGLRSCIGQKYAVLTIKTLVTHVIRLYKIETDLDYKHLELKSDISVRSKNGNPIRLVSR